MPKSDDDHPKKPHRFTPEEARIAGRRGGERTSTDREHMARIARKGKPPRPKQPRRPPPHQRQTVSNADAERLSELRKGPFFTVSGFTALLAEELRPVISAALRTAAAHPEEARLAAAAFEQWTEPPTAFAPLDELLNFFPLIERGFNAARPLLHPSPELLDVHDLLRELIAPRTSYVESTGLSAALHPDAPISTVRADRIDLRVVFAIILENALAARAHHLEIRTATQSGRLHITVIDDGHPYGLTRALFLQGDDSRAQLDHAHEVLHRWGGTIALIDERHATLEITFPLAEKR